MSQHGVEGVHRIVSPHEHNVVGGTPLEMSQRNEGRADVNGDVFGGMDGMSTSPESRRSSIYE